jgi:hypothetical protein
MAFRDRDDRETLARVYIALASHTVTVITGAELVSGPVWEGGPSIPTADAGCLVPLQYYPDLVSAVFKYDWEGGADVTKPYSALVASLVSAKTTFIIPAFQVGPTLQVLRQRGL